MLRVVERVLVVEDSRQLSRSLCGLLAATYPDVRACRSVADVARVTGQAGQNGQGAGHRGRDADCCATQDSDRDPGQDWWPDLVLLDVVLPDGDAEMVLELLGRRLPAPVVIAMSGAAGRAQSFALATRGVRAFLDKPLDLDRVHAAIRDALEAAPDLVPALKQIVGHKSLADVETEVRAVMIDEALARSAGSRRGAARLLEMSRQLLQYALRRGR